MHRRLECHGCGCDVDVETVWCSTCSAKRIKSIDQSTPMFSREKAQIAISAIRTDAVMPYAHVDECAKQLTAAIAIIDCIPHDVLVAILQPRVT